MSSDHLAKRAIAASGHHAGKTKTFKNLIPTIEAAIAGGSSIKSLYRELKKSGHEIGSETWFRKFVRRLQAGEFTHDAMRTETSNDVETASPAPARGSFGDARFQPDYE